MAGCKIYSKGRNVGNYINERRAQAKAFFGRNEISPSRCSFSQHLSLFDSLLMAMSPGCLSPSLLVGKVFYSSSGQFSEVWIGSVQCTTGVCLWGGSRDWNASKPWTCDISVLSHPINEKSWQNIDVILEVLSAKFYLVSCSTFRQQPSQHPSGIDAALTWTPLLYIWFPLWPNSRDFGASDQKFHFGLITVTGGWVYSFHGLKISNFFFSSISITFIESLQARFHCLVRVIVARKWMVVRAVRDWNFPWIWIEW